MNSLAIVFVFLRKLAGSYFANDGFVSCSSAEINRRGSNLPELNASRTRSESLDFLFQCTLVVTMSDFL